MERKILKLNYIIFFVLLGAVGCKKNETASGSVQSKVISKNTIIPESFDWETVDYMPAPAGTNILVPWASGSNQSYPLIYNTDIKKADGWELVYNTFSVSSPTQPLYFVLYNRYRGLLRGYFYLNPGASIPSSNITHSLVQRSLTAPIPAFTYSVSESADLKNVSLTSTIVQPYKTNATGTWYAAEFEMSYDPNVGTKDAAGNLIEWDINSISSTDVTINGTSQGTVNGTFVQPTPAPDLFKSLVKGAFQIGAASAIGPLKLAGPFKTALENSLNAGAQGAATGILNGIFGGNGGQSTQYVNLTSSADYKFSGTLSTSYYIASPSMYIPGSRGQDNVTGSTPLYKKALGIVSLTSYPKANILIPEGDTDLPTSYPEYSQYIIDKSSYNIVFNPEIINSSSDGAVIQNLKSAFVCLQSYYRTSNPDGSQGQAGTAIEQIGDKSFVSIDLAIRNYPIFLNLSSTNIGADSFSAMLTEARSLPNAFLRVSFDVVPNNGAAKSTIVKTFKIFNTNSPRTFPF